ncbi:cell division protein FtsZ, partial [Candidatus Marsarchaeota archaeon]|nr:cell division protein FtsZ [Candidatus Marsarchaeota archaeon]
EAVFQELSSRISPDALLKWGARIDTDMQKDVLKVMIVVSGVDFKEYSEKNIEKEIKDMKDFDLDTVFG